MICVHLGHVYQLNHLGGDGHETLTFVDRGHGKDKPGTTNQEVLRVLIDRVKFLNEEKPWAGNADIIQHLRMALSLHELRHLELLIERPEFTPEKILTGVDGHFKLINTETG